MIKWKVEEMKLMNETSNIYMGKEKIYDLENTSTRKKKIEFVDSLYDGKLSYLLNLEKKYEEDEFIKIGEKLGFSKNYILTVYHKAKMEEYKQNKIEYLVQDKKLKRDKIKILVVGNTYNIYDNLLGKDLINLLNKLNCEAIYINIKNPNIEDNIYKN